MKLEQRAKISPWQYCEYQSSGRSDRISRGRPQQVLRATIIISLSTYLCAWITYGTVTTIAVRSHARHDSTPVWRAASITTRRSAAANADTLPPAIPRGGAQGGRNAQEGARALRFARPAQGQPSQANANVPGQPVPVGACPPAPLVSQSHPTRTNRGSGRDTNRSITHTWPPSTSGLRVPQGQAGRQAGTFPEEAPARQAPAVPVATPIYSPPCHPPLPSPRRPPLPQSTFHTEKRTSSRHRSSQSESSAAVPRVHPPSTIYTHGVAPAAAGGSGSGGVRGLRGLPAGDGGASRRGRADAGAGERVPPAHGPGAGAHHVRQPPPQRAAAGAGRHVRRRPPRDARRGRLRRRRRAQRDGVLRPHGPPQPRAHGRASQVARRRRRPGVPLPLHQLIDRVVRRVEMDRKLIICRRRRRRLRFSFFFLNSSSSSCCRCS